MAYTRPTRGAAKYGTQFGLWSPPGHSAEQAKFGETQGAGLWMIGIDPASPTREQDTQRWLDNYLKAPTSQKGQRNYNPALFEQQFGRDDKKVLGLPGLRAQNPNASISSLVDTALRSHVSQSSLKPKEFDFMQIVDPIIEAGLSMIPGVGVPLAVAYGGIKGGVEGGPLGGLTGALGAYGAGSLGQGLYNGVSAAGGVGNYLSGLPGKIGAGISNFGNSFTGGNALTNINTAGLFPSAGGAGSNWIEQGVKAGLPGAVRGVGGIAGALGGSGGSGMSWLTEALDFGKGLGISGGDLLRAGGDLLSGYLNTQAIKDATKAQTGAITDAANLNAQGTKDQLALLEKIYGIQTGLQEPFRVAGLAGTNKLLDLLGISGNKKAPGYGSEAKPFTYGMKDFNADPGYQFRMSEGLKALDQQAAARGGLISGNALRNAQAYGQNMASDEYQRSYGRAFDTFFANRNSRLNPLQSLAGMGQTTTNTLSNAAGNFGTNTGNVIGQGAATQGNLLVNAGDVRASGYLGNQNSWNSAITNALSRPGQSADNAMMRQLMTRMLSGSGSNDRTWAAGFTNPSALG